MDPGSPLRPDPPVPADPLDRIVGHWQAISASLPDAGVFIVDRDLRYRLAAGEALRAAGVVPSDILGRTVREAMPPEIVDAYEGYYRRALAGGTFAHEHFVHGRHYVSRGTPLRDASGTVVGALALSFDLDGTAGVEARVLDREAVLSSALGVAGLRLWEWRIGEGIVVVHAAGEPGSGGAPVESLTVEAALARVHEDDRARVGDALRRCAAGRGDYDETYRFPSDDGSTRWIRSSARHVPDVSGVDPHGRLVGVLTDVTEMVTLRTRLRRREAELASVADNAPAILARVDRSLRHVSVNRAIGTISGREPEEFAGRTSRELGMPEPACSRWEAMLRATFSTGAAQELGMTLPGPAGDRHFEARMVPERGEDGTVETVLYVAWDATELYRTQAALREADRRKDEFLAMLAHELRNPLAPLRTSLRLLERDVTTDPGRHAVRVCARQVGQLSRLVDDLLEVSRVTLGKIVLRLEQVALQALVYEVVETVAPTLSERAQHLALDLPAAPIELRADPLRLAQVLENLLSNASKYTDAGGRVTLRVVDAAQSVSISVTDTGVGIEQADLTRLFEPFTQVDATIERSRGGLGIGLALVRRLVELHGGRVTATSEGRGRGARFEVVLPHARPAGAQGGPQARDRAGAAD